jgi:hypothetical protein
MSRAINLNLTHDQVQAAVMKHGAVISAIERLFPRGTRVVLTNGDHAAATRRALKAQVIDGPVERTPLRVIATRFDGAAR